MLDLSLIFIILAPAIGLFLGFLLKIVTTWLAYKQTPAFVDRWSRLL